MIQSIPSPASSSGLPGLSVLSQGEGTAGESTLFSALLDEMDGTEEARDDLSGLLSALGQEVQPALPPADLAAMAGKILPPVLPVTADLPAPEAIDGKAAPQPVAAVTPATLAALLPEVAPPADSGGDGTGETDKSALPAAPTTAITTASSAALPLRGSDPAPEASAPATDAPDHSASAANRNVPLLPESASPRAVEQMERHRAEGPGRTGPKQAEAAPPQAAKAPAPAEEVRLDIPLQVTPGQPAQGNGQIASPVPQVRPMEFAALIERLTTAREAVSSQSVSITVSHQDFGPVRLHFRPEELGLSVSVTSADPDFARAAAAAPAPVLPVQASEQATNATQQRGESASAQANAQGHGSAQSRGGSPERRDDPRQTFTQPQAGRQAERKDPRSGIFA